MLAIERFPLGLVIFELLLLLSLLLLRLDSQFLELVAVHLHVSPNYTVRNSRHCCVPMLILASMQEPFYDDWVGLGHIGLD